MILILIGLLTFPLFGQPVQEVVKSDSQKIYSDLSKLKGLKATDFDKKIDEYRSAIEKYIEKKKRVCNGEFTTVILTDDKIESSVQKETKKLSSDEKKLCFNELKAIYKTYINNLFLVRTRFLEFLNKKRIDEMALIRDNTLKSIDSTFKTDP